MSKVKSDVEAKCERKFDQLKAVKYRMIMMDGIAYLIKVRLFVLNSEGCLKLNCDFLKAQVNQSDEYVHLRVVTPLGFDEGEEEKPVLTFVLTGKSLSDILFI